MLVIAPLISPRKDQVSSLNSGLIRTSYIRDDCLEKHLCLTQKEILISRQSSRFIDTIFIIIHQTGLLLLWFFSLLVPQFAVHTCHFIDVNYRSFLLCNGSPWHFETYPRIGDLPSKTSFGCFCSPDVINFTCLKTLFVITLAQNKQIWSFDTGETHTYAMFSLFAM